MSVHKRTRRPRNQRLPGRRFDTTHECLFPSELRYLVRVAFHFQRDEIVVGSVVSTLSVLQGIRAIYHAAATSRTWTRYRPLHNGGKYVGHGISARSRYSTSIPSNILLGRFSKQHSCLCYVRQRRTN